MLMVVLGQLFRTKTPMELNSNKSNHPHAHTKFKPHRNRNMNNTFKFVQPPTACNIADRRGRCKRVVLLQTKWHVKWFRFCMYASFYPPRIHASSDISRSGLIGKQCLLDFNNNPGLTHLSLPRRYSHTQRLWQVYFIHGTLIYPTCIGA